jgi:hypothetical protein
LCGHDGCWSAHFVRPNLALLAPLYHALPEGVRYSLRPLNALDELGTLLPARGRVAMQPIVAGLRSVTAMLRGRGRLVRLSGVSAIDGSPLHALVDLGSEGEAFWGGLLFAGRPTRTIVGETRSRLGLMRAGRGRLDADIVLIRIHRLARTAAERAGFITMPSWVDTYIDTRGTLDDVLTRSPVGRRTLKSDLRRIAREGLEPRLGSGDDVTAFLRELYEPFTRARWNTSYVPLPPSWVRQAPRFCQVLWIERGGERVGGALLEPRGTELRDVAVGVRDRDDPYGVRAAQYYFAIRHAIAHGYRQLALGGSRPVLSDGVVRTKRKWGAVLTPTLQWDYLALALPRGPEALRGFLTAHPLVAEMDGRLYAVVDPATKERPDVAGIAGFMVPSSAGWATHRPSVPHVAPATAS